MSKQHRNAFLTVAALAAGLSVGLLMPGTAWGQDAAGSIVAWGRNNWGQCNVPAPNRDFVAVAAGNVHGLGLKGYPRPRGDLKCDGAFNGADIDPFFLALGDPAGYVIAFPDCDIMRGDMNRDGADIDPFFECLGSGCP